MQNVLKNEHNLDISTVIDEIDRWYNCAKGYVCEFSKEDCRVLLQNWLLSLMMCDVSFLITISPADDDYDAAITTNGECSNVDTVKYGEKEGDFSLYCTSMNEFKVL